MDTNVGQEFIDRMNQELQDNKDKGDWEAWIPTPCQWLYEMEHHKHKLMQAIKIMDIEAIREHSADVANLAEKAFVVYGKDKE